MNTAVYVKKRVSRRLKNASSILGADKSLARPGRKQAEKHITYARDFIIIETKVFFFFSRQDAEENLCHSDRNISLFPSWSGYGLTSILCFAAHMLYLHLYPRRTTASQYVNTTLQRNQILPPPPQLHSVAPF